ncbi:DUF2267 domain-containing protein [Pseudotabrizicola sp. 4114]|uniref:DUF2267 domain-containing protein n=1 Tax=Pseudotabrizicola sp. 4114 TaxID=2817731 RepID=UPI0028601A28|nr:uncharacterized protein (DUF2267 family) [Pseudorhodobacter sp. 4114]
MPMPWTYRHASREWQGFLADVREEMGLISDNMAYTAVEGVLRAFRDRLTPQQVIDFAQVLPSVLRAVLVAQWQISPPLPPGSRADWTAQAKALRPHHNLTPDTCVAATAIALRKCVPRADLDRVLATLPAFAADFWSTPGIDPATLGPRIV